MQCKMERRGISLRSQTQTQTPIVSEIGQSRQSGGERRRMNAILVEKLEIDPSLNVLSEADRVKTFKNWSNPSISPTELAKWGFFYTGRRDLVQCAFCSGRLQDWRISDDPCLAHEEKYPQCPFVLGYVAYRNEHRNNVLDVENNKHSSDVSNFPHPKVLVKASPVSEISSISGEAKRTLDACVDINQKFRLLGICTSRPKWPDYATLANRLSTYKYWPRNKTQTPAELSEAGFCYMGERDRVQCFYCGGVLHNWLPRDQPWVEHARWFGHCDFVRLCKGEAFIQAVKTKMADEVVVEVNGDIDENLPETQENVPKIDDLTAKIPSWQGHEDVRLASDMGYDDNLIAAAIISNEMTMFDTVGELIERIESIRPAWEKMKENGSSSIDLPTFLPTASSSSAESRDQKLCKICVDGEMSIVFLPCAHLVCCPTCSPALQQCPLCRTEAVVRLRVILT